MQIHWPLFKNKQVRFILCFVSLIIMFATAPIKQAHALIDPYADTMLTYQTILKEWNNAITGISHEIDVLIRNIQADVVTRNNEILRNSNIAYDISKRAPVHGWHKSCATGLMSSGFAQLGRESKDFAFGAGAAFINTNPKVFAMSLKKIRDRCAHGFVGNKPTSTSGTLSANNPFCTADAKYPDRDLMVASLLAPVRLKVPPTVKIGASGSIDIPDDFGSDPDVQNFWIAIVFLNEVAPYLEPPRTDQTIESNGEELDQLRRELRSNNPSMTALLIAVGDRVVVDETTATALDSSAKSNFWTNKYKRAKKLCEAMSDKTPGTSLGIISLSSCDKPYSIREMQITKAQMEDPSEFPANWPLKVNPGGLETYAQGRYASGTVDINWAIDQMTHAWSQELDRIDALQFQTVSRAVEFMHQNISTYEGGPGIEGKPIN